MTEGKGKEGGGMPPPLAKSGLRAPLGEYNFSFAFAFPLRTYPFNLLAPLLRLPTHSDRVVCGGTGYLNPIR
jgi:hypothetical protein